MDNDQDNKIRNIIDELNEETNKETFNRKYFDNKDSETPSNTPSAKKSIEFSLKNVDFSKFLESRNDYNSYASTDFRHALNFCENAFVGSSQQEVGYCENVSKPKLCNALICTKCDVKVSMFKNMKWNETCDYLFFRNNYGDQIKLSDKMISCQGTTCYSCQCSWDNITEDLINVEKLTNVSWTCGGHHS